MTEARGAAERVSGIATEGAREAGFDPAGLRRAFGLLERGVECGVVPGVAALVARGGRVAGEAYLGLAHRAASRRVTSDTVWSLASITKPVTEGIASDPARLARAL